MLEIASQIIICLLLATLIGFAIGYIVAKRLSEKTNTLSNKQPETETKDVVHASEDKEIHEIVEPSTEEVTIEVPSQETLKEEETNTSDEIEIPTEAAIEQALEALEAFDETEEDIHEDALLAQEPELLSQPRDGEKDKLTKIKGIGPKLEEKLNAAGIYHFTQIAQWTEANMLWLEEHTLFASRQKKEAWVEESKSFLD